MADRGAGPATYLLDPARAADWRSPGPSESISPEVPSVPSG
ncbi:MAG TPA: hypothetical protein VG455_09480 [Acidimicrobiales bacterium]|nr:hypothetical protein [Acidimicrobiales bacterium]